MTAREGKHNGGLFAALIVLALVLGLGFGATRASAGRLTGATYGLPQGNSAAPAGQAGTNGAGPAGATGAVTAFTSADLLPASGQAPLDVRGGSSAKVDPDAHSAPQAGTGSQAPQNQQGPNTALPRSAPAAIIVSNGTGGGNWSSTATWSGGVVPTAADDVTIANGDTVTVDTAAGALSLTVGQGVSGILNYIAAVANTLTVGGNVTVAAGGSILAPSTGTITTNGLS